MGRIELLSVAELDDCFATSGAADEVRTGARTTLAFLIGEATSESASQYFQLDRLEAAGTVRDLEMAPLDRDLSHGRRRSVAFRRNFFTRPLRRRASTLHEALL